MCVISRIVRRATVLAWSATQQTSANGNFSSLNKRPSPLI
jgi:hypothetical protein